MALAAEANELAETLMPPANRIITIEAQQATMLSLLGRFDEALELLDGVAAKLQPPLSFYLNFVYATIHGAAGNRDEFRRWAQASRDARDQLPEFYNAIMALEQAQIDIWDENFEAAIANIDAANAMLGQSILQTLLDSLGVSELYVNIARLYLEAGAVDEDPAALREGRSRGARVLSVCNVMESSIARESDDVLYTHAGPEIGVASTKAFTASIVDQYLLACTLAGVAGALFILYKGYIGPTTMSAFAGAGVLMMVLLGGMGTLWGPLVGAAIFIYIQDYISTMSEHWEIYLGIVVVFLVLFMPTGFVGLGGYLKRLRRG